MTGDASTSDRILGSLRTEEGEGVVRVEDRLRAPIDDVWSALTEPESLGQWYGEVEGDLRVGGAFRVRHADGERIGRVDVCESPERFVVGLRDVDPRPGQPEEILIHAELAAAGAETALVMEARRLPLHLLAAYAAGVQIHVEHLADHIAGRAGSDTEARWETLFPAYQALSADAG